MTTNHPAFMSGCGTHMISAFMVNCLGNEEFNAVVTSWTLGGDIP